MKPIIFYAMLSGIFAVPATGAINSSEKVLPETFIAECEQNFSKRNLKIDIREATLEENNSESIKSITALARKLKPTYTDKSLALGLTTTELSWEVRSELKSLRIENVDLSCGQSNIEIAVKVLYHTLYVAKEFSPRSCEYNFVRDHELKHVKINNDNMKRYTKNIFSAFDKRFPNKIFYGSVDEVTREMQHKMDTDWLPFIKNLAQKMESEGAKYHDLIDTPEEYARGYSACSGAISAIIKARQKSQ